MTDDPIDLDKRRSATAQREAASRRRPAPGQPSAQPDALDAAMLAEPARSWIEVMEKWRFLLDRYAATPGADTRVQTLVRRALGDLDRLRKREERK
ncbi:hypothetical protein [Vannielia litorea]|uniref:Uncharacterized protein n=1 Tax=Vannielia litorea TaxID=1217970 RepID=A0A1N6EPI3_9RHOB|nr:hypothetical protein [Vannielia litorea]SIN84956.1 hypothetical protein SAMN05444002_0988 [Vannielia litorea]